MNKLDGKWILAGRILRTQKGQEDFDFNYVDFIYNVDIKQEGDFILVKSLPEPCGARQDIGIAPGLVYTKDNILHLKFVDYDDNGIFEFKENKCDKYKEIDFIGTYYESGFQKGNPLQLPTAGKVILKRNNKYPY